MVIYYYNLVQYMLSVLRIYSKFARSVKSKKTNPSTIYQQSESQNSEIEAPPQPMQVPIIKQHLKEDRADPMQTEDSELVRIRLNDQHLPKEYLKRVQQVFHKYEQSKLREVAGLFSQLMNTRYKQKKFDYTRTLPFQRYEEELKPQNKVNKIYLGSQQKNNQLAMKQQNQPKTDQNPLGVAHEYTQNVVVSYLLKRVPRTFAAAVRVLIQIQFRYPQFKPTSMIDFGSGLSSGSMAFSDVFGDSKEIFNIEPNSKMFKLSKFLVQDTSIQHYKSLGQLTRLIRDAEIVFAGYVLNQIESDMIPIYLEALYNKVRPGGFLVILEYGNPFGARLINDVRNWARTKSIKIVMPCPHQQICPLSKQKRWCHFDQPSGSYPQRIFGKLPNDQAIQSQKFSYLVVRKGVEQGSNDLIFDERVQKMQSWDRIVFPLVKKGGHLRMDLCTTQGVFEKKIVAKSHGQEYKQARRLRWGDMWRFGRRIPNKFRKQRKYGQRLW